MTHEYLHKTPLPAEALLFDGSAYELTWRGHLGTDESDLPAIPSPDYAIYLINAVKFHCGQLFHLFDDEEFHRKLQQFYSNPNQRERKSDLWYIHFLLILAFGKIFISQKVTGTRPSGSEFFHRAIEILPPAYILCQEPIASTEILCCIALYLQCFDHRQAAYIYVRLRMPLTPPPSGSQVGKTLQRTDFRDDRSARPCVQPWATVCTPKCQSRNWARNMCKGAARFGGPYFCWTDR